MKKITVVTTMAVLGIAGSAALPVQAASGQNIFEACKTNGYVIAGGQISSLDELKDVLSGLGIKPGNNDCPVIGQPGENQPDTDVPDTDVPDTDVPDTDKPDTGLPDGNSPDGELPDSDKPGTDTPEEKTFAEQVVELVNAERVKAGLSTLTLEKETESAALLRAHEIETSFSHTRPDGRAFSSVLTDLGISFKGAGENIAWGQSSPEEVMTGWMNSEGHRANILNPQFTKMGVGYYQNAAGRNFWTQLFTY